ncbi:adenylate/guanylate cyclase domain-containing protein [Acidobacteriota bacterium]
MMKKEDVFSRENEQLERAEKICEGENITPEELQREYGLLTKVFKKLLRQTKKLTRVSDSQQNKLNRILKRLMRYVSYQLYKKITQGKEVVDIHASRKKLTVFFSDIKDFSIISSRMEGEALSEFLNLYLDEMTKIVLKWGGTLDKYIGDTIMVFFGDDESKPHKYNAVHCVKMAVEMQQRMKELHREWYEKGYREPMRIRIGISTGFCTIGNFGSTERMDYTIIGNPVNLAARLESAAESNEILISHETWALVKDEICCEQAREYKLKGFHLPIIAYKVYWNQKPGSTIFLEDLEKGISLKVNSSKTTKKELLEWLDKQEFDNKIPNKKMQETFGNSREQKNAASSKSGEELFADVGNRFKGG